MYKRIQELCKNHETTITALCVKITGSKGNLSTWKSGNIRSDWLADIAAELNTSVDYLLTGEEKKIPSGLTEEDWELFDLIKQVPPEFYESSKAFLQALVKKQDQE